MRCMQFARTQYNANDIRFEMLNIQIFVFNKTSVFHEKSIEKSIKL